MPKDGDRRVFKRSAVETPMWVVSPYEVPKEIEIREALSLTSVGKIDKKALKAHGTNKTGKNYPMAKI